MLQSKKSRIGAFGLALLLTAVLSLQAFSGLAWADGETSLPSGYNSLSSLSTDNLITLDIYLNQLAAGDTSASYTTSSTLTNQYIIDTTASNYETVVNEAYELVYAALLNKATSKNGTTISGQNITTTTVWKVSGTCTLSGILYVKSGGKLLILSNSSESTLNFETAGRIIVQGSANSTAVLQGSQDKQLIINGQAEVTVTKDATDERIFSQVMIDKNDRVSSSNTEAISLTYGSVYTNYLTFQNFACTASYFATIYMRKNGSATKEEIYLANTTFQNLYAPMSPGIRMVAEPTNYNADNFSAYIKNCTFQNCLSFDASNTTAGGSAICSQGNNKANLYVDNCTFSNNGTLVAGGAIRWHSGNTGTSAKITNSTFDNNYAANNGGAIYNGGQLSASGCTFTNNLAGQKGGAIATSTIDTNLTLTIPDDGIQGTFTLDVGTVIENNTAGEYGGGVCVIVAEGLHSHDSSPSSSSTATPEGTTINYSEVDLVVQDATIRNNTAAYGGGLAMYVMYDYSSEIIIKDGALIDSNTATEAGGGICFVTEHSSDNTDHTEAFTNLDGVTMEGGTISNNTAGAKGGGIYIHTDATPKKIETEDEEEQASNCRLKGGILSSNAAASGGGIYIENGSIWQNGSTITGCSAIQGEDGTTGLGGGIYSGGGRIVISAGSIMNCTAEYGGGIFLYEGDNSDTEHEALSLTNTEVDPELYNIYIKGGTIAYNTATQSGGGLCVCDGQILVDGGTIDSNTAQAGHGGGVYLFANNLENKEHDARIRVRTGKITNNTAAESGGAIAVNASDNSLAILKVVLGVNVSHYTDGVFTGCAHTYVDQQNAGVEGYVNASCPVISGNRAGDSGGAIYVNGGETTYFNIYCVEEEDNLEDGDAGQSNFMMVDGGNIVITTGEEDRTDNTESGTNHSNGTATEGFCSIVNTIHIAGGSLDIYGEMKNPSIDNVITIELESSSDHFEDHRVQQEEETRTYWVHYYENFTVYDTETDTTYVTGTFKAIPVAMDENGDYVFTVSGDVFVRDGYSIRNWHTTQLGYGTNDHTYAIGDVYSFNETENTAYIVIPREDLIANTDSVDSEDGTETIATTLVLYAIWSNSRYTVAFEPNADTYSGQMSSLLCDPDTSYTLTANDYTQSGYLFTGWNTRADGKGISYEDQASILGLAEAGELVTLYAQWALCEHDGTLIYQADGDNRIVESCSACGGHTATATISATDVAYDGTPHPATIQYSQNWLGTELTVQYAMAPDIVWDEIDSVDDEWTDRTIPVHAGDYIATIRQGGAEASVTYSIARIQWATPSTPEIVPDLSNGTYTVTVSASDQDSDASGYLEYRMKYTTNSVTTETDWQTETTFNIPINNIFYYFYVCKAEDRDHMASETNESVAYLAKDGFQILFQTGEGINLNDFSISSDGNTYTFNASLAEGYHVASTGLSSSITTINASRNPSLSGPTPNGSLYTYTITGLGSTSGLTGATITISLSGAVKDAALTGKSTPGLVFTDFNTSEPCISADSAFTVQYSLSGLDRSEYASSDQLTTDSELPVGTTIILKTASLYYYYLVESSTSAITLTAFRQMGTKDVYFTVSSEEKTTYQFIVDFSQVEESQYLTVPSLTVSLRLTASSSSQAPELTASIPITLKAPSGFRLNISTENTTQAVISGIYTASAGQASIWDERQEALVLTAPANAPGDLYVQVQIGSYNATYAMNASRQFILPISAVSGYEATIQLRSDLFPSGVTTYEFDAVWLVSASNVGSAPFGGYQAAEGSVTFTVTQSTPSLRIDDAEAIDNSDTSAENRFYHLNDTPTLVVSYAGLTSDQTITLSLEHKENGSFVGDSGYLILTIGESTTDSAGTRTYLYEFALEERATGSYRLLATVQNKAGDTILRVPYYFIVLNEDDSL